MMRRKPVFALPALEQAKGVALVRFDEQVFMI